MSRGEHQGIRVRPSVLRIITRHISLSLSLSLSLSFTCDLYIIGKARRDREKKRKKKDKAILGVTGNEKCDRFVTGRILSRLD